MPWSNGGSGGGGGSVNSVVGVSGQTVVNDLGAGIFQVGFDDPTTLNNVNLNGTMDVNASTGQINGNGKIAL